MREDNQQLAANLRKTHGICKEHGDVASASFLENWIDEAERRVWFLFEPGRGELPRSLTKAGAPALSYGS
ncbi:MAG: ferritin-like domain-containing protein [Arenicellales bacterium]